MIELKFKECQNRTDPAGFESGYTDYMLKLRCKNHGGWLYGDLCPREDIAVPASVLALGITAYETLRIQQDVGGKIAIFRPGDYLERLDRCAHQMGLPAIDRELAVYGIKQLLSIEKPYLENGAVFARVTLTSAEADPSVFPVKEAWMTVTLEKRPIHAMGDGIEVCTSSACILSHPHKFGAPFAYAVRDGLHEARTRGYDNVLWVDAVYGRYVDSLAGMDLFFHIGDKVYFCGDGVTAKSAIELMQEWGIDVDTHRVSTDQLIKEYEDGTLTEVFAVNTEDTVLPVKLIDIDGKILELPRVRLAKKVFDTITSIQSGEYSQKPMWVTRV